MLTALRFVFALMVFGAHCYVIDGFFGAHFFKEGFVGVSFFFVLSGFIISYRYQCGMEAGALGRKQFWVARVARIYPLHWLTLLVAASLGGYVVADGAWDWGKHFLASLTLTNAYVPQADYFFSFNSPSWSLCCEQLFYLSFPFLVPLASGGNRLPWLFCAMSIVVVAGMYATPEADIKAYWYVNPITRFPDFIVGMLLYRWYRRYSGRPTGRVFATAMEAGALALFLAFYIGAEYVPKVYRYSCYYWLPVSAVLGVFALQRGLISRLLSCRPLVLGGEISYSFYLIHLFLILAYAAWNREARCNVPWQVSVPLLLAFAVGISLVSYRYFEKPIGKYVKSLFCN